MRDWRTALADRLEDASRRVRRQDTPPPVEGPDGLAPLTNDVIGFWVREWSVRHDLLRARLEFGLGSGGHPTHAIVYFSSGGVEVQLEPTLVQSFDVPVPPEHSSPTIPLGLRLPTGQIVVERTPGDRALEEDPSGAVFTEFLARVGKLSTGRVLEIGSRARSGTTYRQLLPPELDYVGVDIIEGPNVDVVGDAHDLSAALPRQRFDAALSIAVFEHLAMPWKAAVSLNSVLNPGALAFISSHQSFPVHESPWDFWRFSDQAWRCIFNRPTGFEVVQAAMGEPAELVANASRPSVWRIEEQPAFFTSNVLVRKIGEAKVDWSVTVDELDIGFYPT